MGACVESVREAFFFPGSFRLGDCNPARFDLIHLVRGVCDEAVRRSLLTVS